MVQANESLQWRIDPRGLHSGMDLWSIEPPFGTKQSSGRVLSGIVRSLSMRLAGGRALADAAYAAAANSRRSPARTCDRAVGRGHRSSRPVQKRTDTQTDRLTGRHSERLIFYGEKKARKQHEVSKFRLGRGVRNPTSTQPKKLSCIPPTRARDGTGDSNEVSLAVKILRFGRISSSRPIAENVHVL